MRDALPAREEEAPAQEEEAPVRKEAPAGRCSWWHGFTGRTLGMGGGERRRLGLAFFDIRLDVGEEGDAPTWIGWRGRWIGRGGGGR